MGGDFAFLDPGPLVDGDLSLELRHKVPAQPEKGYVPAYSFVLWAEGREAGHLHLRAQNTPLLERVGGHIGYGVNEAFRGRHYAERACRLVLPLARAHGFKELWMTCNPDNVASRRTLERLGAEFVEIVDVPVDHEMYKLGELKKCRYRMDLG